MDQVIQPGDELIVVAADDDTTKLSAQPAGIQEHLICEGRRSVAQPERTLVLGWNWRAPLVVRELDAYVAPGSSVTVVADEAEAEAVLSRDCCGLTNQAIEFVAGDTTNRRTLDSLDVSSYSHIVVLSYSDCLDVQAADARTLITLLHLRDIAERTGRRFSIVSEMLDIRNRNLAEVTHADDFIVSDKLVSLMLSQVSENKALNAVFADLFDPEGSEIYIKPVEDYVRLGEPMTFYTLVAAAARRGEVAFGYRLDELSDNAEKAYGVVINPKKSALVTFAAEDRVIVLAES